MTSACWQEIEIYSKARLSDDLFRVEQMKMKAMQSCSNKYNCLKCALHGY